MASSDLPPLTIPDESDTALGPQTSKSSLNPISSPQNASLNSNRGALTPRTIYANRKAEREAISLQMMMHMNAKKVKSIQSQFDLAGGAVDIVDFVRIMRKHLPRDSVHPSHVDQTPPGSVEQSPMMSPVNSPNPSKRSPFKKNPTKSTLPVRPMSRPKRMHLDEESHEKEVTANLVELFREVDINGDGEMEWDEFTRFIVEKASLFEEALAVDKIPSYTHNVRLNTENIDIEERQRHTETLDTICEIEKQNQFAVIEAHSKYVSLYSSYDGTLVSNMYQNAVPLSLCHVPTQNALITSCADMTLNVWNLDDPSSKKRYVLRDKWPTKEAMMSLTWVETHKLLYAGSTKGVINAYSLADRECKARFTGHSDIVMEMIAMQGLNNVVSASLDTTVRIWDTYTEQETNKLLGHQKGVFSLSYNPDHRFIVSAGFDHDAYIWSPFVNTLLFTLKGHTSSLVGCQCVENTNELVTADSSGVFKIWDLRNFMCCQTFTSEHEQGDLNDLTGMSSFCHVKLPAGGGKEYFNPEDNEEDYRIICGTKRLFYFDQFRAKNEPVTDVLPITVALFNTVSLTILTVAGKNVKIWDAVMGNVKVEYNNLSAWDLSCACLDDRQRKFILGDVSGNMRVYNYSNGALMKKFPPFEDGATVANLVYCGHAKCVIAASINGNIRIYDELDPENCIILRDFDHNYIHQSLALIDYVHSASLVVAAGALGNDQIKFFDFETGKCVSEFKPKDDDDDSSTFESEDGTVETETTSKGPIDEFAKEAAENDVTIYAMTALERYPLTAVATSDGKISVYGMVNAHPRIKNTCILTFENTPPPSATYKGENEQEYPLLHMPRLSDMGYQPHEVSHRLSLRRRSSSHIDEDSDPTWVTKPRFDSPRARMALPAHSLVWDEDEEVIYTGDESGRIRKWSLKKVLEKLKNEGLAEKKNAQNAGGGARYGTGAARVSKTLGRMTMQASQFQNYLPAPIYCDEDVNFLWGVEGHDDSCSVSMTTDTDGSKSLLSWSSDRTVKAWTVEGRPMGMLLAGLERGVKNPAWDFQLDAHAKTKTDDEEASVIYEQVIKDEQAKVELGKARPSQLKELQKSLSFSNQRGGKTPKSKKKGVSPSGSMRSKGSSLASGTPIAGSGVRAARKIGDAGGRKSSFLRSNKPETTVTSDPAEEERRLKHLRVQAVCADMKTMSAQNHLGFTGGVGDDVLGDLEDTLSKAGRPNDRLTVPKGFKMTDVNKIAELGLPPKGSTGVQDEEVEARRIPRKVPNGFRLSGMNSRGTGELDRIVNNEGRGKNNNSQDLESLSSQAETSTGMSSLAQTFRKYDPPPSVVPPSPGRRDIITPEARLSHSRMQRAMQSWEERSKDAMIGDNPFGDDEITSLEEFANMEGIVVSVGEADGAGLGLDPSGVEDVMSVDEGSEA
ncbi:hypothetical protein TrVE_jg9264 [Triparma verrucosa]|uniref:EF-hand domain-containing protein n=1 Tax=Triparma verrucosa TaxID=1606542 RepID=A0A9W7BIK5_9STRA|nr:hypothetical protein TrVE_jg9264 [Triparma verrucosa]